MTDAANEARAFAENGMTALRRGDGATAEQAFLAAIDLGWPGPDVWVALAQARRLTGDRQGRVSALERALETDPDNPRARLYRAQAHYEAGDSKIALRVCEQVLANAPPDGMSSEMQTLFDWARKLVQAGQVRRQLGEAFADDEVGQAADDTLFVQSLDILTGLARVHVPQPTRYLYPGLPLRQFYPRAAFGWAAELEARTSAIRRELEALIARSGEGFVPYVEGTGREGELDHALKNNPDWSAFYLVKQGQRIEENIARCPETMAAIEAIGPDAQPAPAPSVLFSLLKPGTRIPPHHGMLNTRLICHLPLIVPDGCGFRVGNDTRTWQPEKLFLFDDTIEHEAWNQSDEPRYVLIFEIWRPELTPRQRELVTKLFQIGGAGS